MGVIWWVKFFLTRPGRLYTEFIAFFFGGYAAAVYFIVQGSPYWLLAFWAGVWLSVFIPFIELWRGNVD